MTTITNNQPTDAPKIRVTAQTPNLSPPRGWVFSLSALVIAGILIGTLIPMPYHRVPPDAPFFEGYRYFSWELTTYRDMASNILLFIPVGIALWAMAASIIRRPLAMPVAFVAGALLSTAIEWTQVFVPGRYPCAIDVCMNTIGTLIGANLAAAAVAFFIAAIRTLLAIVHARAKQTASTKDSERMAA